MAVVVFAIGLLGRLVDAVSPWLARRGGAHSSGAMRRDCARRCAGILARFCVDPAGYLDRLSPLGDLAKTSGRVNVFAPFCYEVPPYFLGRLVRSHKAGESLFIRLAQAHTSDLSLFLYCRLSTCERLQAQ